MIEESLLGPPPLRPEGLACPRGRLNSPPAPSSRPASASSRASAARSLHTPSPIPAELLPAPRGQLQGRQGAAGQVEGRLGNGGQVASISKHPEQLRHQWKTLFRRLLFQKCLGQSQHSWNTVFKRLSDTLRMLSFCIQNLYTDRMFHINFFEN